MRRAETVPGRRRPAVAPGAPALALALALAGCNVAPPYAPPVVTAPAAYRQAVAGQGQGEQPDLWAPATPADAAPRGAWWTVFGDPTLDTLEARLDTANPTLAGALAAFDQARAFAAEASAGLAPSVALSGAPTTNRQSVSRPLRGGGEPNLYAVNTLQAQVGYEFDVWGRIRNLVAEGRAQAQASAGDLAAAKLSLEAELAGDYVSLRGLDAQAQLLADTAKAYARALALTQARHAGGVASGLDVDRAAAQLSAAKAQASDVAAARALYQDAIAALTGQAAPGFAIAPAAGSALVPVVPAGLPSSLLERRPDIAAAERRAFAANRQIGVAKAAFYPTVSLDAVGGFQNTGAPNLISLPNSYWTLGPQFAVLLFDGGRRHAVLAASRAAFDLASANYKATVLAAFQQVQDGLSLQVDLGAEAKDAADAVTASQATARLSLIRYKQGATNYLDVVIAQTAELSAEQQALSLATRRRQATVGLVQALGGGWTAADLPTQRQAGALGRPPGG
jgi:NodT family efflux transporter outer membrane factor (OMF) lipoprotein